MTRTTPLWNGPLVDGITFSLLSKFVVCRDRFHIKVVRGLREREDFSEGLEWGNLWHEAEEAHLNGDSVEEALVEYRDKLLAEYPDEPLVHQSYGMVKRMFPIYVEHWRRSRTERKRMSILAEVPYRVPLDLPSGRGVIIRGKYDGLFRVGRSGRLQENKTKGYLDEEGLTATVHDDLQTGIYQNAARTSYRDGALHNLGINGFESIECPDLRINSTLYNIIMRPKIGEYGFRRRKGRGKAKTGAETERQFYDRVASEIAATPDDYFKRWTVRYSKSDLDRFNRHYLYPLLEQLLDWWESIQWNPMDPWVVPRRVYCERCDAQFPVSHHRPGDTCPDHPTTHLQPIGWVPNPHHWRTPWGVYNSIFGGRRGDYFHYLTKGSESRLDEVDSLFPELDDP